MPPITLQQTQHFAAFPGVSESRFVKIPDRVAGPARRLATLQDRPRVATGKAPTNCTMWMRLADELICASVSARHAMPPRYRHPPLNLKF